MKRDSDTNPFSSISLSQLWYFHILAKTEHFTDAARELYITQPALSSSIKALETELAVPLIVREGRRNVHLSKYGVELDAQLTPILEQLEKTLDNTRNDGNEGRGSLRIGTIPTVQYDFLPALLKKYWAAYGHQSRIKLTAGFSNFLIKGLKAQEFDAVICAYVPEEQSLEFISLLATSLVAVVHKKHPYAKRESFNLDALHDVSFATYGYDTPIGRETRSLLTQYGNPRPTLFFDDEFTLCTTVQANENIIGLMTNTREIDPFKNDVCVLPVEDVKKDWHKICLAYDTRVYQKKETLQLIELVQNLPRNTQ